MTILKSPRTASLAVAVFLGAAAFAQLRLGEESVPAPLRENLIWLFGYDARTASRLVVGIEFAAAAAVLAAGTRLLALVVAGFALFFSLACVSRAVTNGGLLLPVLSLAASAGLVVLARASVARPPAEGRRGLSPAWPTLGALAAATVAGQWSASASFHVPGASPAPQAAAPRPTVPTIDLDMKAFEGRPLAESVLAKYVPRIVELCATRDAYIVVYSPYCESCHTLFTGTFGVPRPELVIAVAVPMSDDATSASSGAPRPIECLGCEELSLPVGPNWLVAPPMVLKVEGGVLTCVADRFGGDCLPK
jgi:hypothetical protein